MQCPHMSACGILPSKRREPSAKEAGDSSVSESLQGAKMLKKLTTLCPKLGLGAGLRDCGIAPQTGLCRVLWSRRRDGGVLGHAGVCQRAGRGRDNIGKHHCNLGQNNGACTSCFMLAPTKNLLRVGFLVPTKFFCTLQDQLAGVYVSWFADSDEVAAEARGAPLTENRLYVMVHWRQNVNLVHSCTGLVSHGLLQVFGPEQHGQSVLAGVFFGPN